MHKARCTGSGFRHARLSAIAPYYKWGSFSNIHGSDVSRDFPYEFRSYDVNESTFSLVFELLAYPRYFMYNGQVKLDLHFRMAFFLRSSVLAIIIFVSSYRVILFLSICKVSWVFLGVNRSCLERNCCSRRQFPRECDRWSDRVRRAAATQPACLRARVEYLTNNGSNRTRFFPNRLILTVWIQSPLSLCFNESYAWLILS